MGNNAVQEMIDSTMGMARPYDGVGGGFGVDAGKIIGIILIILGALIAVAAVVFYVICWWKLYTKAGRPGWAIFVPVYCAIELFNITWGNGVYFLYMLIPGINVLVILWSLLKFSEAYGHGVGYTLGLIFLPFVFIPVLAFGKSKHVRYEAKKAKLTPPAPAPVPEIPVPEVPMP